MRPTSISMGLPATSRRGSDLWFGDVHFSPTSHLVAASIKRISGAATHQDIIAGQGQLCQLAKIVGINISEHGSSASANDRVVTAQGNTEHLNFDLRR